MLPDMAPLRNGVGTDTKETPLGMPVQVTLSSSGVTRSVNLDWASAKFTSWAVTGSSSGTFTFTTEGSLDDVQILPSSAIAWFALSSATTANSSINIFSGALAAIRLNAAAVSSALLTLRILQGIGG
jgi:hypothetical protein